MLDKAALKDWIERYSPARPLSSRVDLVSVSGDAGFREYFRINCQPSMLVAYAPPEHENNVGFVAINRALAEAGVHTPRVFAVDYQQGYILQEDLGQQLYQGLLSDKTVDELYGYAETSLLKIQCTAADSAVFPSYDAQRLKDEMALFPEWFVVALLGEGLSLADQLMLDNLFDVLVDNALEQPQVVVHRDFHSRNLLLLPKQEVGVIDFQDAVLGPCTYDLVSLLRDCYVRWPASLVTGRVSSFLHRATAAGLLPEGIEPDQYQRWFDLMGLQRHIKVLGIFARLYLRDGKSAYLGDLPLVIRYSLEVAQGYPETRPFYEWFCARFSDVLMAQSWYRDWHKAGEL